MGNSFGTPRNFLKSLDLEEGLSQEQFEQTCQTFDPTNTGVLGKEKAIEFFTAYAKANGLENPTVAGEAFFRRFDANGDGQIEYSELCMPDQDKKTFLAALNLEFGISQEEFTQIHDTYASKENREGPPGLSMDEAMAFFKDYAKAKKYGNGEELAKQFFAKYDANGDGFISYDELVQEDVVTRMASHTVAAGGVLQVTLSRPFGFRILDSPWGTYIEKVDSDGGAARWNAAHQNDGQTILPYDNLVGALSGTKRLPFEGLTHRQVHKQLRAIEGTAVTLYLQHCNSKQTIYLDNYRAETSPEAVGDTYEVSLGKPLGFAIVACPAGAFIMTSTEIGAGNPGALLKWNKTHKYDGRHIQEGDLIAGYTHNDEFHELDDYLGTLVFLQNYKQPLVHLRLQRQTLHQKAKHYQQRHGKEKTQPTRHQF